MVYTVRFFLFKMQCFIILFGSCIIHILYTGCAKIKKKSGAKRLISSEQSTRADFREQLTLKRGMKRPRSGLDCMVPNFSLCPPTTRRIHVNKQGLR